MTIFYRGDDRYSLNQLARMGLTKESQYLAAGFKRLGMVRPVHDPYRGQLIDNGTVDGNVDWVVTPYSPSIQVIKTKELADLTIAKIKSECRLTTDTYFESDALGTLHKYDIDKADDKINYLAAIVIGSDLTITCTDSDGLKLPRVHTSAQVAIIFMAGVTWIQDNKTRTWDYITAIRDAAAIDDTDTIKAIRWKNLGPRDNRRGDILGMV